MIYVRLAGGLGNQLYQLLAAVLLSRHVDLPVIPLTEALLRYRKLQQPDSLRLINSVHIRSDNNRQVPALVHWTTMKGRVGRWAPRWGVHDRNFPGVLGDTISRQKIYLMDGYFQEKWNAELLREAIAGVTLLPSPGEKHDLSGYDCVVHIRGGDFLQYSTHCFVDARYYIEAVRQSKTQGHRKYGVITDDPTYAQSVVNAVQATHPGLQFSLLPAVKDALLDFDALRRAPSRIIGNSTFAWWAAAFDTAQGYTWSPAEFVKDRPRDFFLGHEQVVDDWASR